MAGPQIWRHVPGKVLLLLVNVVAATALIFEGYNQGVYGTVSGTPGFIAMAGIGHDDVVTDSTKQGGLAAAYYFGAMWACFIGGHVGDKIGRKRGVLIGTLFGILGAALQAASQNSNMFICARIIAGVGIGFMNAIILPWVSELSQSHDRGSSFSLVFVANFLGIVISYWINFGIRNTSIEFRWRFPLGWMVIPLLIVDAAVPFLPESPRWLISNSRRDEAIAILCKLRGDLSQDDPKIKAEVEQLDAVVEATYHQRNNLKNIVLGGRYSGNLHLGRRAVMGFALQWIQQWSGILAVVGWAGKLFSLAGFDPYKSLWLSGLVNTVGIPGTAAAALVIDRIGRVKSLLTSFIIQAICLFLVAALIKTGQDAAATDPELSSRLGTAAASFVFIYMWFFTMFNIIPVWIYGTEIWPQEIRAKGYSFTIFGWATGCGMTQFLIPIMLQKLGYGTYLFFGAVNVVVLPIIWLIYPEVANRSLEEVSLLFTSDSLLVGNNMKEYNRRIDEAGGNVAVAARHLLDEVDGIVDSGTNTPDKDEEKRGTTVEATSAEVLA
ncbi:Sugar transporter STL1 [Tolypocladium ophioglossoides CBS 100239]|uniref:Sugar transporter STL1 n=1 Tax=Tolypocladium ophioglossoides (strain CBS 100239) TaxID=1163406 RepID=A0A0L0MZA5_TOLOC|nr:Sugar transporter STL1 [Tolypocladium ophioglossoides CBS 100239]